MVPVFTHTPPSASRFSMTTTFLPSLAACTAARCPAGPDPMTARSKTLMGRYSTRNGRRLRQQTVRRQAQPAQKDVVLGTGRKNLGTVLHHPGLDAHGDGPQDGLPGAAEDQPDDHAQLVG